jgi:hypothetical protein
VQKRSKIILIIGLVMWVLFHTAWLFFGRRTFELGQAFIIYASSLILLLEFKDKVSEVFHAIALNEILDELFFNPYELSWNEYLTLAIILLRIFTSISLTGLANTLILKIQRK